MLDVLSAILEAGVDAAVYLAGLERTVEPFRDALAMNGYSSVAVLGPNQLERLRA